MPANQSLSISPCCSYPIMLIQFDQVVVQVQSIKAIRLYNEEISLSPQHYEPPLTKT